MRVLFEFLGPLGFILTAGLLLPGSFRKNPVVLGLACLLAFGSAWLTIEEWGRRSSLWSHESARGTNIAATEPAEPRPSRATESSVSPPRQIAHADRAADEANKEEVRRKMAEADAASRREELARRDADERAWLDAVRIRTIEGYRRYIERFAGGIHAAEARHIIEAAEKQLSRAADEEAWSAAMFDSRTAGAVVFKRYVERFPDGAHANEARRVVADVEFTQTNFSLQNNIQITSGSSDNQVYLFVGRNVITECAHMCMRRSTCVAFTSDNTTCSVYNSLGFQTAVSQGWITGVRR